MGYTGGFLVTLRQHRLFGGLLLAASRVAQRNREREGEVF